MVTIGITGGVGCGKTQVLQYIQNQTNCPVIVADELAKELETPGHRCFEQLVELLGSDILDEQGFIQNAKMAEKIFHNQDLLEEVNHVVHPAVKEEILARMKVNVQKQEPLMIVEAALLLEEGYDQILDQIWYVFANEQVRRERLKASRGYTDDKIDRIMSAQLSEEVFRTRCQVVLDNSGSMETTEKQIDILLEELLCPQ